MEAFDEVYVVSDLHLGGDIGHQIFKGGDLLRDLLRLAAANDAEAVAPAATPAPKPPRRKVAFVINGDFVDFLAEPGAVHFDPDGADHKLLRISVDPTFKPVWDGLRDFVSTPHCRLIVVLGNHDLELALPRVQQAFLDSLGIDEAGRGRVQFSVTGAGFSAAVGGAQVLCLHGNEVDPFNVTDFERLRREVRDQVYGVAPRAWVPNAGTKLVIDIMNGIKRTLPFIDLLKPETDAVIPVLFALDQVNVDRILDAIETAAALSWDAVRRATGFLSASEAEVTAAAAALPAPAEKREAMSERSQAAAGLMTLLSKAFEIPASTGENEALLDLLERTEDRFRKNIDPLQLAPEDLQERLGGWNLTKAAVRAGWSKLLRKTPSETLRMALKHVSKDRSFELTFPDDDFDKISAFVPVGVDFVIAGHTHLRRSHPRGSIGHYINTGTWARLMQLTHGVLDNPTAFKTFYDAIRGSRSIQELEEKARDIVQHLPSVAIVRHEAGMVRGKLMQVVRKANTTDKIDLIEVQS